MPTVLYVGGFELPDRNAAAHRVLSNAKVLRDIGYRVVLIGVSKQFPAGPLEQMRGMTQGFDTWSIPYPDGIADWIRYVSSIDALLSVAARYEGVVGVVCYNYPALALWKVIRHCRRLCLKCICDCTEWYETPGSPSVFAMVKRMDTFARMAIVQKKADGVICISTFLQRYYESYTRVVLVPPLVDLGEPKWLRRARPSENSSCVFVYAGSPGARKDRLDTVIAALSQIDESLDYEFRVVGLSSDEYLRMNPSQAGLLSRLGARVAFLGRLSHIQSIEEIKSADYAVFVRESSRTTNAGFPTKFVESAACGTPAITTRCSDLSEYIEDGRTGFFVDDDGTGLSSLFADIISGDKALQSAIDPRVFDYREYAVPMRVFLTAIGV